MIPLFKIMENNGEQDLAKGDRKSASFWLAIQKHMESFSRETFHLGIPLAGLGVAALLWTGSSLLSKRRSLGSRLVGCMACQRIRIRPSCFATLRPLSVRNPVRSRGFTPYDLYGKIFFSKVLKSLSLSKSLPAWKTYIKIIL